MKELIKTSLRYQDVKTEKFKGKEFNTVKLYLIEFQDGNIRFDFILSNNCQVIHEECFSCLESALKRFYKFVNKNEIF